MRSLRVQDPAEIRSMLWAGGLFLAAGAVAVYFLNHGYGLPPIWALIVLAGLGALGERQGVALTDRVEMSISFLPLVFAAVAFGPFAAFAVGALSNAFDVRPPVLRWVVYTPVRALSGAAVGAAVYATGGDTGGFGAYLLASSAAFVTYLAVDGFFSGLTLFVRQADVRGFIQALGPLWLLAVPLYIPLVALFVYGYHAYSLRVVIAFFIPALGLQRLFLLYQKERDATRHLASANERLKSANLSFATALVATLDARDRYTAGHSAAVAIYARDIAARMDLGEEKQNLVHLCGLVHDVGKIGLPAGVLEKPGALSLEERRQMEKHSEIGEQILRKVDDYEEIADVVRHHHERVDGHGYPDGLRGDEIPLLARIISVADAYNAMTSDRPYRDALPSRVARLRLAQAVESQFDTSVVAAFEAILAAADEDYRMGVHEEFVLQGFSHERVEAPLSVAPAVAS